MIERGTVRGRDEESSCSERGISGSSPKTATVTMQRGKEDTCVAGVRSVLTDGGGINPESGEYFRAACGEENVAGIDRVTVSPEPFVDRAK